MLVIQATKDGLIQIGDVQVFVQEVRGNSVRLAIKAPTQVPIQHIPPVTVPPVEPPIVTRRAAHRARE